MILIGNQRGGAHDLAVHLTKDENDHVHIHELRGFVANDLKSAFREVEAVSKGTKCRQYLYSLSLNPPQNENVSTKAFEKAIDQAENRLGLTDQPRAIVFHEKEGRRHVHVVWSRIDVEQMKAVQLSHSKRKLSALSKQLYLDHGWRLPAGHVDKTLCDPANFTLEDWQQAKRTGSDPRKVKEDIQNAWHDRKNAVDFEESLKRQGYTLAKGDRRAIVVVDRFGEVRSLARQLKIKTKALKEVFGNTGHLRPVKDVQNEKKEALSKQLSALAIQLNQKQQEIKAAFEAKLESLRDKQRSERKALTNKQEKRAAREAVKLQSRFRTGLKGAWDFIRGEHYRISQKNKLEAAIAQSRDEKEKDNLIKAHLKERQALAVEEKLAIEKTKALAIQKRDIEQDIKEQAIQKDQQKHLPQRRLSL